MVERKEEELYSDLYQWHSACLYSHDVLYTGGCRCHHVLDVLCRAELYILPFAATVLPPSIKAEK